MRYYTFLGNASRMKHSSKHINMYRAKKLLRTKKSRIRKMFLTSHGILKKHLRTMRIISEGNCRFCKVDTPLRMQYCESVLQLHIIMNCTAIYLRYHMYSVLYETIQKISVRYAQNFSSTIFIYDLYLPYKSPLNRLMQNTIHLSP